MKTIYKDLLQAKSEGKKLLAILLDPDKIKWNKLDVLFSKINRSKATHIFVGGSTVAENLTGKLVEQLKEKTALPIILFPGDFTQITSQADAILFLSLLSGRNPEYLIGQQIKAVPILQKTDLEVVPTSYILIDGGKQTAVSRVSQTNPIAQNDIDLIVNTAKAGEYLGHKLTYLEAGSGADFPVSEEIIKKVSQNLSVPIIVGGGIRSQKQMDLAYQNGADFVVIGTAFEEDLEFFD